MKEKDLINKWLNNAQLTHTESEAFKNLNAYDSYVRISDTAKNFKAPEYDIESNLEDLKTTLIDHKSTAASKHYITILMRVAAIFVIGIGTYFALFYTTETTVDSLASQKISVELPDHTVVQLNALSSISYQEKDWENNRKIKLEGEAYFKVAKGKKFDVQTSSGIVSVLGTQFNVKHRDHYFEVICYEGLVSVTYDRNIVKLPAGKTFKILKNVISKGETNIIQPDWIENKSMFSSTPYSYILKEFERQYDVTIIANNIDQNKLFTGNFVHSDIQTAIQSITIPMRLKYKINDNNITLYKE
ncbi:FecR family protein [Aquimarina algiphila]|uniref:FecR family protein n=1 Tax=Aquimarina algiphila TaxID=2047982 RepID=UPI0023313728|nr:FecR family protein [Aquimarina algiphila]